jgi:hypothetical protein
VFVTPSQCQYYAAEPVPDPVERTNEKIGIAVLPSSTISKKKQEESLDLPSDLPGHDSDSAGLDQEGRGHFIALGIP